MYNDLDVLLILALIKREHGAKAMYKKAVDMFRGKVKVEPKVCVGILTELTRPHSVNFASRKLEEYIQDYLYYAIPAREVGAEGGCGMVIYNGVVYPILLSYEKVSDYWWATENETEIYTAVLFWLIWEHGISTDIEAEFLMFAMYGFRGVPRWWCIKNIGGTIGYDDITFMPESGETTPTTYDYSELVELNKAKVARDALNESNRKSVESQRWVEEEVLL